MMINFYSLFQKKDPNIHKQILGEIKQLLKKNKKFLWEKCIKQLSESISQKANKKTIQTMKNERKKQIN